MRQNNKSIESVLMRAFFSVLMLLFVGSVSAIAQEHPSEHPSEHPTSDKAEVSKESLAIAITDYVNNDADLKGGFFLVYDQEQDKALALKLAKVHKERLATLGHGVYFACADFNATDGNVYDLDVFMKDSENGLEVYDISVHKTNGEARYGWVEKDGVWSKSKQ
ncbi:MAG: hypothetical protein V3W18_01915 [candidate division Zixibacteria bacterium]